MSVARIVGSLSTSNMSDYLRHSGDFFKQVALDILPGYLLIKARTTFWGHMAPSLFCDDIDDPQGTDFVVNQDNKGKIAQKLFDSIITFNPPVPPEKRSDYQKVFTTVFEKMLENRLSEINSLRQRLGVTRPVRYMVSLPHSPLKNASPLYHSIGDRFSLFSPPVINGIAKPISIRGNLDIHSFEVQIRTDLSEARRFILAHELSHIARGDHLIVTISLISMGLLNTALWVSGMGVSGSLMTKLIVTLGRAGLAHTLTRYLYCTLRKAQEKEADLLAMKTLNSSEGAQKLFASFKEPCSTLEHPSMQERLSYAKSWKPAEQSKV